MLIHSFYFNAFISVCYSLAPFQVRQTSSLCVKNNVSCSTLDDSCIMFYFPLNSTNCSSLEFKKPSKSLQEMTLGVVDLETYQYKDRTYVQTAFNLTFSNVSWTDMRFRFMQNGNTGKNTCRHFKRSEYAMQTIVYDCLWSNERYEGKPFTFEYEAWTKNEMESARVLLTVPFSTSDSKFKESILVKLETSTNFIGHTKLTMTWRPLPAHMEVTRYNIYEIWENRTAESSRKFVLEGAACDTGVCTFSTHLFYGMIRFGVQPVFENDVVGAISFTPIVLLGAEKPNFVAVIWLLLASILIPVLALVCLKARKALVLRMGERRMPKMLIVYSPTTTPHLHFVESLVHYLNTHCRVTAWMDETDVPSSKSKDPFEWCSEAINTADVICIIASPFFGRLRSSSALYHTDKLLLRLLREHYGSGSKARYCALLPPYTSGFDLPVEAGSLRKYRFPQDLDEFLHYATSRWHLPGCLLPAPPGGSRQFELLGSEVSECLEAAQLDLKENIESYQAQLQANAVEYEEVDSSATQVEEESCFLKTSTPLKPLEQFKSKGNKQGEIASAEVAFSEYLGNVNLLNLSGDKCEPQSPRSDIVQCAVHLDELDL